MKSKISKQNKNIQKGGTGAEVAAGYVIGGGIYATAYCLGPWHPTGSYEIASKECKEKANKIAQNIKEILKATPNVLLSLIEEGLIYNTRYSAAPLDFSLSNRRDSNLILFSGQILSTVANTTYEADKVVFTADNIAAGVNLGVGAVEFLASLNGGQGGDAVYNTIIQVMNKKYDKFKDEINTEKDFSFIYNHPLDLGTYKKSNEEYNISEEVLENIKNVEPTLDFYINTHLEERDDTYLAICDNCDNWGKTEKKTQWVLITNSGVNFFENYITQTATFSEKYQLDNEEHGTTGIKSLEEFINNELTNNELTTDTPILEKLFDRLKDYFNITIISKNPTIIKKELQKFLKRYLHTFIEHKIGSVDNSNIKIIHELYKIYFDTTDYYDYIKDATLPPHYLPLPPAPPEPPPYPAPPVTHKRSSLPPLKSNEPDEPDEPDDN